MRRLIALVSVVVLILCLSPDAAADKTLAEPVIDVKVSPERAKPGDDVKVIISFVDCKPGTVQYIQVDIGPVDNAIVSIKKEKSLITTENGESFMCNEASKVDGCARLVFLNNAKLEPCSHAIGDIFEIVLTLSPEAGKMGEIELPVEAFFGVDSRDLHATSSAVIRYGEEDYHIVYDANGGTNPPAEQIKKAGASINITSTVPVRDGYTFLGWAENSANTEPKYRPGDSYIEDKDITLYAVWEPVAAGTIEDAGRTMSLEGEIHINQYAKITGFDGVDLTKDAGLLIWNHPVTAEEAVFGSADVTKKGLIKNREEYGQRTDGIPAAKYADNLYLRIYVKNTDGTYTYGPLKKYSVRYYCDTVINRNKQAKDTCIALLHFGAAAQNYFGYNTGDLADKNIVDQYPGSNWDESMLTPLAEVNTEIANTGDVSERGKTLSIDGAIKINFYFAPENFTVSSAELLVWDGVNGVLNEGNVSYRADLVQKNGEYGGQSREFASAEYGRTIFACAKFVDSSGKIHYSNVIAFSPEAYASAVIGRNSKPALAEAMKKMVIYGEEAQKYFHK